MINFKPVTSGGESADQLDTLLRQCSAVATSRVDLWCRLLATTEVHSMAEVGVYMGRFSRAMLDRCPAIEQYWMIDPWRHLPDWNKPINTDDQTFERIYSDAIAAIAPYSDKCRVLRGTTTEVIDQIPDCSLDVVYIDGDHTLRGISVDLIRTYPKVRDGGWVVGDDFSPSIWQHKTQFEPTLVFPFAVHFAEALGVRIFALPFKQFLIQKGCDNIFSFIDLTGSYSSKALAEQFSCREMTRHKLLEMWRRLQILIGTGKCN